MEKYLIHIGICGFGNQLLGFKEACIIAKMTNRTIVLPYFIPHGTIRSTCKDYYNFNEIFDDTKFTFCDFVHFEEIQHHVIKTVYYNRNISEKSLTDSYFNISVPMYNLENVEKKYINKTFVTNDDDFTELQNIQDDILVLVGTFNSIKLNSCSKNGCQNNKCSLNEIFTDRYNDITNSLIFNNIIYQYAGTILSQLNLKKYDYCVFHMRILDLCKNKSFEYCYNNYNEKQLYQSIKNYLFEIKRIDLIDKLFIMAPPDFVEMTNVSIFNSNYVKRINYDKCSPQHDKFILSIIELCICETSYLMLSSPTNTPNETKVHTRSSFTLHTKDLRKSQNKNIYDICISDLYNKTIIVNQYNIKQSNEKKIISFSLYNDKDIYNYGVLLNYELKKYIYIDWIIRIYMDETVNKELFNNIINNFQDIEVIIIKSNISPMYYRFLPLNDPDVKVFISRDLDSIIGYREETMVNEWLQSNKRLHLIHEVLPGHRHIIMAGMMGFKNNNSINDINNNIISLKINETDIFNYEPFNSDCKVKFENNNIIIYAINSPGKKLCITSDMVEKFYKHEFIKVKWCGGESNLIDCKLEKNGDIIVKPSGKIYNYYFKKLYENINKNNITDICNTNIINYIYNYQYKLQRINYIYLDEQNWLSDFFKSYLHNKNCLDHNKNKSWDYSIIFNTPFTKLDSLFPGLNEHYVGHRIDTKKVYEKYFIKSWESKKKISLILTTTVNIHDNINFNEQNNNKQRLEIYLNKINKWLTNTNFNIIVVENSNYKFDELPENNERFEKIIFDISNVKDKNEYFLKNNNAKGQYENYSINYAYQHSNIIKSSDYIIKITGRFFVPNLEKILLEQLNQYNYKFIRQIKHNKCEIVGCHKDKFTELFKFPVEDNHVESSYQNIIKKYNIDDILTLPLLPLDNRSVRGNGCHYNEL